MSEVDFGGYPVSAATITQSWGLSPATAQLTLPGSVTLSTGQTGSINLGGSVFTGIVASAPVETADGTESKISLVDFRVQLMWSSVYCTFNNSEIREDNPETQGIDRQKRFWHILPDNWDSQTKTWTDKPYAARDILTMLLSPAGWGTVFHSIQDKPVYNIDANTGAKLGNVVQRITEDQGLVFTLTGTNTLVWGRKGEGSLPDTPTASRYSSGEALSTNDTQIRIVGERNRYQEVQINLEPDWNRALEYFWAETTWVSYVKNTWGLTDPALIQAKAISVTMREAGFSDGGMWGSVSRMEIPVWTYLQEIVFKAYRVPRTFTINGIGIDDIELVEGLLVTMQADVMDGTISTLYPREYYPQAKAFVVAQGQQLDLFDPKSKEAISDAALAKANTAWQPVSQFSLDLKNKVVLFEHAVFSADALYVFPNQGTVPEDSPLYNIAVPNGGVTVGAANVRASLVFEAERFSKTYGSGLRKGFRNVPALGYHALSVGGIFTEEILYLDGEGAEQKANEYAQAFTSQDVTYYKGGYSRNGTGTGLNGQIDRVTTSLGFNEGFTETVEWAKERAESNFVGEREMERRQGVKDLYPGQLQTRSEVAVLQAIAKVKKETRKSGTSHFRSLSQILTIPLGTVDCSPATVSSTDTWLAGQPVFLDPATKLPDPKGTQFAGIVVAENVTGSRIPVAAQGIVPVRVRGPVSVGDAIGIDTGSGQTAKKDGNLFLGTANNDYDGSDVVLLPVNLGAGASQSSDFPFKMTGYIDGDDQGWLRLAYGEANGTPLSDFSGDKMSPGDDPLEMKADDNGIVYVHVVLDPETKDVTEVTPGMAADQDSIGADDTETDFYVIIGPFVIDPDGKGDSTPIPYNTVRDNINFSTNGCIAGDGTWSLDQFNTYTRDPIPSDYLNLEVHSVGDAHPEQSSMYLSVGDADDSSADKLLFTEGGDYESGQPVNGNSLQLKWVGGPELWMADLDQNNCTLDAGGLTFWDKDTSLTIPLADYATDHLSLDQNTVWLGKGDDETVHLEISDETAYVNLNDAVWLGRGEGTWHLEISDDTAFVQLGKNAEVFLGNGTGGWHLEISGADGYVQIGDTILSDGLLKMGTDAEYADDHIKIGTDTFKAETITYMGADGNAYTDTILGTGDGNNGGGVLNALLQAALAAIQSALDAAKVAISAAIEAALASLNDLVAAAQSAADVAGDSSDAAQAAQTAAVAAQTAAESALEEANQASLDSAADATRAEDAADRAEAALAKAQNLTWVFNAHCNPDGSFTFTASTTP